MSNVLSSSRPSSPTKPGIPLPESLRPNAHPYAIKTTSTGILSRSATTSSSTSHSYNHYVPLPPQSPTKVTHGTHAERGSRHRYSRSLTEENMPRPLPVPPEELYQQQQQQQQQNANGHVRTRAETLPGQLSEPGANPKLWTPEQLAVNVPEIADFVRENEITGRAFLRFDEGVLDAKLRQSVSTKQVWPQNGLFTAEPSGRRSVSPSKARAIPLPNDEDEAYLSSSSSTSSITGTRKRRHRPNGRVHGMVASFERSSSVDDNSERRQRGSISSVDSNNDEPYFYQPQTTGNRPLPFPPSSNAPLLLPTSSFPPSLSTFNSPQSTGTTITNTTPHATGNGTSRPLPSLPQHPSLRLAPILTDTNTSGEMSMDDLIAMLNEDTAADADAEVEPDGFVNTSRRDKNMRGKAGGRLVAGVGAAAWEADFAGETVKRALPAPAHPASAFTSKVVEDEMTIEELLALEDRTGVDETVKRPLRITRAEPETKAIGAEEEMTMEELLGLEGGAGAAAWVDEPETQGGTMKRVSRVDSEQISLSAGRRLLATEKQTRVRGIFTLPDTGGEGSGDGDANVERERREVEERAARQEAEWKLEQEARAEEDDVARTAQEEETRKFDEELATHRKEMLRFERHDREEEAAQRMQEEQRTRREEEKLGAQELQDEEDNHRGRKEEEDLERHRKEELMAQKLQDMQVEVQRLRAEADEQTRRIRTHEEDSERRRLDEEEAARKLQDAQAEVQRLCTEAKEQEQDIRSREESSEKRRLDAEERLASSIEETQRLIGVFRARLEEVERRVEELQSASANAHTVPTPKAQTKENQREDPKVCVAHRLRVLAAWALSTPLGAVLPAAVAVPFAHYLSGPAAPPAEGQAEPETSSDVAPSRQRDKSSGPHPLYPTTIPRYALLLSIGMCALVLRSFMRWGVRGARGAGVLGVLGIKNR
ncbi:hypothetical protein H0H81_000197 [Sphagnurus paluster]|uniref:Uncharacterized protein n=1 Tax=Sphagnurus paluster TaxID=117069 RepID=A0A9P7GGN6_9AGAR|nr:hypothetical protein H0H81_000197 [Sphagnurus paluster]